MHSTNTSTGNIHRSEGSTHYLSVVWGKRSSKKHKTWEGDGSLEVSVNTATLRDIDGKYLGSTSVKPDDVEEGCRLVVGSNEVEIIERLSGPPSVATKHTKPTIDDAEEHQSKRTKPSNPASFTPNLVLCNNGSLKISKRMNFSLNVKMDYEPLIMPEPSDQHQKKYNLSKRPISEVSVLGALVRVLRPHQRSGVTFLYECLMGYRNIDQLGCILADEMGLGKTLQCITVCYTLLKQGPYGMAICTKVLILTPSSLVDNWNNEINKWLGRERAYTYQLDAKNKASHYANASHIPFLLISYEMFAKHFEELKEIRFDIIICDEGHRLKNSQIKASVILDQMPCRRRVILTGTPIQNDLQEFHALINFVNPGIIGTYQEFKRTFEIPIIYSQQPNAAEDLRELGEQRALELSRLTDAFILRRTQDINNKYLPKKQEFVVFCRPSELQQFLLRKVLESYENKLENTSGSAFQLISMLKKICNHPSLVQSLSEQQENSFKSYVTSLLPPWEEMGPFDSGKLIVVLALLQQMIDRKERIVLVSYHTKTLDMLQGLLDHFGYKFSRLDGTTASSSRTGIVDEFNNPKNDFLVFLLSAKAGGVGLNLVGASRLVLFDNDWNPASDLQALSRIWRDGQKKSVYIYRLVTAGTIEEKIFQRQLSKTSLGGCVVDGGGDSLKLSTEDLKDLFSTQEVSEFCATHELLKCVCNGDGQVESHYYINL